MRILICHNFYQQKGGEDQVFRDEQQLLRNHGHEVATFTRHNDAIDNLSKLNVAASTIWNRATARELTKEIKSFGAEVVHFHNTLPLISPAGFRAASAAGAAVVMTLHNYRMMCPKGTYFRDGKTCELCAGRTPLPSIQHRCYRDSRAGSAVISSMMMLHRGIGTFDKHIHAYIALCEFARQKHLEGGLPADRLELKPNFLMDESSPGDGSGDYMMFLGRLSPEKGLRVLLEAWVKHRSPIPLRVVGQGPLADEVRAAAASNPSISLHDSVPRDQILNVLGKARALIVPSIYYEGFPKTIVESLACGTPVLASNTGAMGEIIRPGESGRHFRPGDADDLMSCVRAADANPHELNSMRETARRQFEECYTPEINYGMLLGIYERAIRRSNGQDAPVPDRTPSHAPQVSPVPSLDPA